MTDAVWNAQLAVSGVLAAASVSAGRVYDQVPQDAVFPYVEIGETVAQPDDAEQVTGTDELLTLHVWSRYRGQKEVKQIMDTIYAALHHVELTIAGRTHSISSIVGERSFRDPDGLTRHGVVQVRIFSHI